MPNTMFLRLLCANYVGLVTGFLLLANPAAAAGDPAAQSGADAFAQLDYLLATPTDSRLATGAPGPGYWQQRADYDIAVTLDDEEQRITGRETITYHNNSPHDLPYLWLQLDQNRFRRDSDDMLTKTAPDFAQFSYGALASLLERRRFEGGVTIDAVTDADGEPLPYTVNRTMMRIDLAEPLAAGERLSFSVAWSHNIIDATVVSARGGYEYFPEDGNYLYEIAQWYPRMAAYTDYAGWQHKQFLGRGEFTLELGDYDVSITVPADHVVAATGELQNADAVLTPAQRERFKAARSSDELVFVVTPEEAAANAREAADGSRTWRFRAENVRDFAFASSRKFIWDARRARSGERDVLAMSFYPNEAEPLWSQYSTAAIAHTIDVYSRYTFEYPYPVAISVNGPVGGMEYPMISFNKPRPYADGTYWDVTQKSGDKTWERSKYGLISVIIHEVGHNYFPMVVNSDERQWTWMDEGLNTFLQFLTEQAWEEGYPSRRGEPAKMTEYMASATQVPIMTNSESIHQFGNNAYGKPATALNILRESIMGRELFDHAFREYAERWQFRRPTPADFFRTMEDASAMDLDWFWRGWFYGTGHVDVALGEVALYGVRSPGLGSLALQGQVVVVSLDQEAGDGDPVVALSDSKIYLRRLLGDRRDPSRVVLACDRTGTDRVAPTLMLLRARTRLLPVVGVLYDQQSFDGKEEACPIDASKILDRNLVVARVTEWQQAAEEAAAEAGPPPGLPPGPRQKNLFETTYRFTRVEEAMQLARQRAKKLELVDLQLARLDRGDAVPPRPLADARRVALREDRGHAVRQRLGRRREALAREGRAFTHGFLHDLLSRARDCSKTAGRSAAESSQPMRFWVVARGRGTEFELS